MKHTIETDRKSIMKGYKSWLLLILVAASNGAISATNSDEAQTYLRRSKAVECADDPDFTFRLLSSTQVVSCTWILKSNWPGMLGGRKKTWCENNETVRSSCKQSCGECGCQDDTTFRFIIDDGSEQDCAWIDENGISEEERALRLDTWCSGNNNVVNYCKASCDQCNETRQDVQSF